MGTESEEEDADRDGDSYVEAPHVAAIVQSKPKPKFKGKYNLLSRLLFL